MAMVVWLFVALVIMQTYTANLTSMLTVQHLGPTVTDIETLKNSNAKIGHCSGSFLSKYLVDVLDFNHDNIWTFNSTKDFADALQNREIAAAFLEVPLANLFLAKYCKGFTIAGPTYKVGGLGFVIFSNTFFCTVNICTVRFVIFNLNYELIYFCIFLRHFRGAPHYFLA